MTLDMTPGEKRFTLAPIIISMATGSAEEVFGIIPPCREEAYKRYEDAKGVAAGVIERQVLGASRVKPDMRKAITSVAREYYNAMKGALLDIHEELLAREARNHQAYMNTGTISSELSEAYEAIKAAHDKLLGNTTALAKLFGYNVPELREAENVTRITDAISIVNGRIIADENEVDPVWDDPETKAFYENLPGLESVPEQLFTDNCQMKEVTSSPTTSPASDPDHSSQLPPIPTITSSSAATTVSSEQRRNALSAAHAGRMEEIVEKLLCCENKEVVDKVAEEFCYLNSRKNRATLVDKMFEYGYEDNGLIPYFGRLIAILALRMKGFGEQIVGRVREEFLYYTQCHEQVECSAARLSNAFFLAELTKFKVCPSDVTFECLNACIDGFAKVGYNMRKAEVLCSLLENCGRFLYRTPQTQHRTDIFLDTLWSLKNVRSLDPQLEVLIENACYFCRPPARPQRPPRDPVREYIRYLIFSKLSRETCPFVVRKLLKVSWAHEEAYIIKTLLKYYKSVFSNAASVAALIAALKAKRPNFDVKLLDALMEEIVSGLEAPDTSANQRRIAHMKLFAELYRYSVVSTQTVFDTLYLLLLPIGGAPDDRSNCFKVRLICVLLESCGVFFTKGTPAKKLDRYLLFFQRYLLTRSEIPPDVIFTIDDCLDLIRPGYNRLVTVESINAELRRMEEDGSLLPRTVLASSPAPTPLTDNDEDEEEEEEEGGKGIDGENGGDEDEDEDDDDDDDDSDSDSDSEEEEEDDDDSDSDSDSEGDDDDDDDEEEDDEDDDGVDEIAKKEEEERERKRKEDEEFDKEFEVAKNASFKGTSKVGYKKNQLDIAIPFGTSNSSKASNTAGSGEGPDMTHFSLLVRRGKKQVVKDIAVDSSSTLAKTSTEAFEAGKREREEVKAKVKGAVMNQIYDELEKDAESRGTRHLGAYVHKKFVVKKK